MKYLVVDMFGNDFPVVFPDFVDHSAMLLQLGLGKDRCLGAGFVRIYSGQMKSTVSAFGKSQSLGIMSRLEDSKLLARMFEA